MKHSYRNIKNVMRHQKTKGATELHPPSYNKGVMGNFQMKKLVILSLILLFSLSIFSICWLYTPPEMTAKLTPSLNHITIKNSTNHRNNIFGPVPFSHRKHYVDYELTCLTCHHDWNTSERNNPRKCEECHTLNISSTSGEPVLLRNAFHRSCKNCHDRLRHENKSTGPVMCRGCHLVMESKN